ncbi:MAG: alpha/beta hydrolase [Chloroflexota bacterium]
MSDSITSTIQLSDITLSYTEWPGRQGPLICLPGLSGHKGMFINIARSLAPTYHLFALDLRGRGDSDKPAQGYGFAYHSRDILRFAEAVGVDSFAIMGHSFGATLGVYLASIRPAKVRALVLIDGGADPKEEVLEAMRPALRRLDQTYASIETYLEAMRNIPFYRPWNNTLEQYLRQEVELLPGGAVRPKASVAALDHDLDMHFYTSMCLHFPAVQCPVLFIRPRQGLLGERGHIFTEPEAAAVVAWMPHCRRVDLPDVNHYTMILQDDPPVIPPSRVFLDEMLGGKETTESQ